MTHPAKDQQILAIAKKHFFIETLETRNSDSLDFHDVSVWAMRDALAAAFEAGRTAAAHESTNQPNKQKNTMTITIERTPRILRFEGRNIEVEELNVRLPFARKPTDISEVGGEGKYKVFVTETREMTPAQFDEFASQLLNSRDWLRGKGGDLAGGKLCVEIRATGRPTLLVDPSGADYGRYVARLG